MNKLKQRLYNRTSFILSWTILPNLLILNNYSIDVRLLVAITIFTITSTSFTEKIRYISILTYTFIMALLHSLGESPNLKLLA